MNFIDPFGLYEEDVHFYNTLNWALESGIESRIALRIAAANQRTDDAFLTRPDRPWEVLSIGAQKAFRRPSYPSPLVRVY